MRKTWAGLLLFVSCLMFSSCSYFANKPLKTLVYKYDNSVSSKNLFVFMRGLGGSNRSFADAGMVEAVKMRKVPFDIIAPNAHFAYYSERTLVERLHEDVIVPATLQGYRNIWLIGVSMGGLGSMLYLKERPEHIDGVFLVVPFLGYDEILDDILAAGGVRSWQPGNYDADEDWERMFWHWIKDEVTDRSTIPLFLGYGKSDEYVKGQRLFSTVIPPDRVIAVDGGHDLATIVSLWDSFLDRELYRK
ncbi:MAG TPA: alpha/beta fold hydrolase [Desulfopila sp.]|nr:alpha/beta fold hydrolase [Desulfopila sp.]